MIQLPLTDPLAHPQIVVACAAAAAAAFALLWLALGAMANRRLRAHCTALAADIEALREELAATSTQLAESTALAAQRVGRLEQAHGRVVERLRFVERRADGRSFDLAIDSARQGAEPGRLAADFGLSRGEAELVARMHGRTAS